MENTQFIGFRGKFVPPFVFLHLHLQLGAAALGEVPPPEM